MIRDDEWQRCSWSIMDHDSWISTRALSSALSWRVERRLFIWINRSDLAEAIVPCRLTTALVLSLLVWDSFLHLWPFRTRSLLRIRTLPFWHGYRKWVIRFIRFVWWWCKWTLVSSSWRQRWISQRDTIDVVRHWFSSGERAILWTIQRRQGSFWSAEIWTRWTTFLNRVCIQGETAGNHFTRT